MTVPVGLATYFFLPDTPYTTNAWFLTQEERDLAAERVQKAGKAAPVKITVKTFKKILSSWRWYAFVIGYVVRCYESFRNSPPANLSHSFTAVLAVVTGTSPFGSRRKATRSSIEISCLPVLP